AIRQAAILRQNELEKRTAQMFAVHQKVSEAIRSRKTFAEVRSLIEHSNVVLTLPNAKQQQTMEAAAAVGGGQGALSNGLGVSYRHQGNLDMYTSGNMKQRDKNRHHPEVREATNKFWAQLPKTSVGNLNKT